MTAQEIRIACLQAAVSSSMDGVNAQVLIAKAKAFEEYVGVPGKKTSSRKTTTVEQ